MAVDTTCETLQFAATALMAAESAPSGWFEADVPERGWLLSRIRFLAAEAGARGTRLAVRAVPRHGMPWSVDLGTIGTDVGIAAVRAGGTTSVLSAGTALFLTFGGKLPGGLRLKLEASANGRLQGFREGAPGLVVTGGGTFDVGYFHRGIDVTEAVARPALSVRDHREGVSGGPAAGLFVDPRHAAVVDLVSAAEKAGEGVTVSSDGLPGVSLVLPPGGGGYVLLDDVAADRETARWRRAGVALNRVRNSEGPAGFACTLLRLEGASWWRTAVADTSLFESVLRRNGEVLLSCGPGSSPASDQLAENAIRAR